MTLSYSGAGGKSRGLGGFDVVSTIFRMTKFLSVRIGPLSILISDESPTLQLINEDYLHLSKQLQIRVYNDIVVLHQSCGS